MALTDAEVRYLTISLLNAETERDRQTRIGASNLANQCDYCLACAFMGISRETPVTNRAWLGRVIGTALHLLLEHRARARFTNGEALIEHRLSLGNLGSYGEVRSTLDFALVKERHLLDWKKTEDKKWLVLADFLQLAHKLIPFFGRSHAKVKLSEREYAKELSKKEYTATGYRMQLHLYAMALIAAGQPIERMSNVFISSDNTGWFDNPAATDYDNPVRVHGINVLSFDYDESYAQAVWERGLFIWNALEGGATVDDFAHHEHCFPCSLDRADAERAAVTDISLPAEVTLVGEAA